MNGPLTWEVARAAGVTTWALVTVSVIWGLLLATRLLGRQPGPRWLTDVHRFLGGLSVVFLGVHLGALALDTVVPFGPAALFVPLASTWKPLPVALGITAFYLLVAVEITSLLRRRLPRSWWKGVHLTSYAVFWLATIHGITAGTDIRNPVLWGAYTVGAAAVLFLTMLRVLAPRTSAAAAAPARPPVAAARIPQAPPVGR